MFIAVDDADLKPRTSLEKIPKTFHIVLNKINAVYQLLGIVHFKPPYLSSLRHSGDKTQNSLNMKNEAPIGHYTAICLRPDGKWTEFDDLKEKEKYRRDSSLCCPSMLIYIKMTN